MRRHALPLTLAAALLATAAACADDASPSPSLSPSPPAESAAEADGTVISREVEGSEVRGGPGVVSVGLGERVTVEVTADVTDEMHLHGYDLHADVTPGEPSVLTFEATIPGRFEVELHGAHVLVVRIEVE
ncbi:hypothetical protein [Streptomyces sp. URMC 129]|uniref:hypothetical protein n=1 Tax=Streptomyces sp. URMC 129 TaxID=3423407 RepID=UPI003F1DBF7D